MSSFSKRIIAYDIEQHFLETFGNVGFVLRPPVPIIDRSSQSPLFTGATINAVKLDARLGQLSVPGSLLMQDCVRLQNLKYLGDPAFTPKYMSCFRMVSVCAHPLGQKALGEGVRHFLHALKQRWAAAIAVSYHSEQTELIDTFNIAQLADSLHVRPELMTWTYGIGDLLTGAGIDVMVGGGGIAPRSAGQLVQLYSAGKPVGYEFGFGVETLGAAVSGGLSPFDAGELADIIADNNEPLRLQLADTVVALQRLYDAGLRPGNDRRGSTMRKMLRLLPAVAERVGFNYVQVDALIRRFGVGQPTGPSDCLANLVADSWKKRDEARKLASVFIANQKRLCGAGSETPANATTRSEAYLKWLGKFLPVEIDELVRSM